MRPVLARSLVLLIVMAAPGQTLPAAAQDCATDWTGLTTCSDGATGGVAYHYDAAERAFYPVPERSLGNRAEGEGPRWQTLEIVASCGGNDPDDPSDALCGASFCATPEGAPGVWLLVFRRLDAADRWEPWPAASGPGQLRRCLTAPDPITLDEIRDALLAVVEDKYQSIAAPDVFVQPPETAIVNLPVLASTDDPGVQAFAIDNPLPGDVDITPTYRWTWSNGDSSTGPGRAYTPGVSPVANPDYYGVLATYTTSGPGDVTLQVTWDVALRVPGAPPVTDIAPLVFTDQETFTVRSARTVLVD